MAGLVGTDELDIAAPVASTRLKAHLPGGHFFGRRTSQNCVHAKFAPALLWWHHALGRGEPSERRRRISTEENKAVSNRMVEAIGRADFDAFDELMAPELAEEFKQGVSELRRSFPDYHGTNEIQVAEGAMVANRFVYYGTHRGEFMGVAPTGRRVTFRGLTLDKVVDGKIVENIVEMDLEDVLGQIGAVVRADPSGSSEEASPP